MKIWILSNSALLLLSTSAFAETDKPAQLYDIYDPVKIMNPFLPWYIAGGLIVAAGLFWLLRRYLRKRRERLNQPTVISPYAEASIAMDELLKNSKDLQDEPFTIAISGILRRFIEKSLSIHSIEMTSEEFLNESLTDKRLSDKDKDGLRRFMRQCDLVKFARQSLGNSRNQLIDFAHEFIEGVHHRQSNEPEYLSQS